VTKNSIRMCENMPICGNIWLL